MASLYCLLARDAETGVIFRRGPSKQTLLIHWDLKTHRFTPGQWFKGQIYVRKSDLSPDGLRLVYFAAKHQRQMPTWIAVSRPPYLTAQALWHGTGTWNGISLFEDDDRLALAADVVTAEGFAIPRGLQVTQKPWPGHFFKLSQHEQLIRDGWTVSSGDPVYHPRIEMDAVEYRKAVAGGSLALYMAKPAGSSHEAEVSYILMDDVDLVIDLKADWADVRGADIFYSQGGKLFRLPFARQREDRVAGVAVELADFSELTFCAVLAPQEALAGRTTARHRDRNNGPGRRDR